MVQSTAEQGEAPIGQLAFANVAMKNEIATCAGEVRWAQTGLQQRWEVVQYENGNIIGCRQEWRDVPTEGA